MEAILLATKHSTWEAHFFIKLRCDIEFFYSQDRGVPQLDGKHIHYLGRLFNTGQEWG